MEAETPVLSPRQERFCRYVSLGHSLTEAAKRAGYSPASARQRGSELYARKEIQQQVAVLADREAKLEERMRDSYMRELAEIRAYSKHHMQYGTALRALTTEIRLSGVKSRRVERRADDEEKEADLRARIEAELRPRIEEEIRARVEAEVRARIEAERQAAQRAEPGLSGTNHDIGAEPDADVPAPTPAPDTAAPQAETASFPANHAPDLGRREGTPGLGPDGRALGAAGPHDPDAAPRPASGGRGHLTDSYRGLRSRVKGRPGADDFRAAS